MICRPPAFGVLRLCGGGGLCMYAALSEHTCLWIDALHVGGAYVDACV